MNIILNLCKILFKIIDFEKIFEKFMDYLLVFLIHFKMYK